MQINKLFAGIIALFATAAAFAEAPKLVITSSNSPYTLSSELAGKSAMGTIYMKDGTALTLTSGAKVINTNETNIGACAIYTEPGAKVTITIENGATVKGPWGIDLQGASTINMAGGTIEATSTKQPFGILLEATGSALNISGGEITSLVRTSTNVVLAADGKVTGGIYTYCPADVYVNSHYAGGTVDGSTKIEIARKIDVVDKYVPADIKADEVKSVKFAVTKIGTEPKSVDGDYAVISYSSLSKDKPVQVWTVTTVTTTTNDVVVTNAVDVSTIEVDTASTNTLVAVPWDGVTVQNIVDVTKCSVGDEMYVYGSSGTGSYYTYELRQENGTNMWNYTGTVDLPNANTLEVKRGTSVRIKRKDASKPLYMQGSVNSEVTTVKTTAKESGAKTTRTDLIGNPCATNEMDLVSTMSGTPAETRSGKLGDQILVQQEDGTFKTYYWKKNAWNLKTRVKDADGDEIDTYTPVTELKIPVGRGFYYRSNGGNPSFTK